MAKYLVKEILEHDQKLYQPGSEIELTAEQAEPLQKVNVIGDVIAGSDKTGNVPAADLIAQLAVAETIEAIDALLGADTRVTVVAAANKRRTELAG